MRPLNSNPPFSNPPRRTRSIHALAIAATAVTRVSRGFLGISRNTTRRSHTCLFSLTEEIVASFGAWNSNYYNFFSLFSFGDPSPPPAHPYYPIFYTGHFDAGQEALTIHFFSYLSRRKNLAGFRNPSIRFHISIAYGATMLDFGMRIP